MRFLVAAATYLPKGYLTKPRLRLRLRFAPLGSGLPGCLADHRDCPRSPGMSTPPSPCGAAERTFIRDNRR
jgi:hypothetical protein